MELTYDPMVNPFATTTELLILGLLKDHGESYGLQLIRSSGDKLKRGTVYVTLGRLMERKLVRSRVPKVITHAGLPRPLYRITEAGERMLEASRVAFNQTEK